MSVPQTSGSAPLQVYEAIVGHRGKIDTGIVDSILNGCKSKGFTPTKLVVKNGNIFIPKGIDGTTTAWQWNFLEGAFKIVT